MNVRMSMSSKAMTVRVGMNEDRLSDGQRRPGDTPHDSVDETGKSAEAKQDQQGGAGWQA
jgi:hypothetical protein